MIKVVRASNLPASWFAHLENIGHYAKYGFTQNLFICTERKLDYRDSEVVPDSVLYFLESANRIIGEPAKPSGLLGKDLPGGKNFESLENELSKSQLQHDWVIRHYSNPDEIFNATLRPLLELANSVVYCDPFLAPNLFLPSRGSRPEGSNRARFIVNVCRAKPNINLRLITAKAKIDQSSWINEKRNLDSILKESNFRGEVKMTARDWPHGRWFRLGFPGGLFITWEPSFSIDYWNKKKFEIFHEITFRRTSLDNFLLQSLLQADRDLDVEFPPYIKNFSAELNPSLETQ